MSFINEINKSSLLQDKNFFIPLVFIGVLLGTIFFPILQVILIELAYLYEPITSVTSLELMPTYFITNILLSAIALILFYRANSTLWIILTTAITVIFLYPTLIYLFSNINIPILPIFLGTITYGGVLLFVSALKVNSTLE